MVTVAAAVVVAVLLAGVLVPAPARGQEAVEEALALGGPGVMHAQVLERIRAATGVEPQVLGGGDRHATAIAVSQRIHPDGAEVVVLATSRDPADALAAGPLLARPGTALLLVDRDAVPASTAEELERLAPDRVVVLGGSAAVSPDVVARARALTGVAPERIAGEDRYATAAAVSAATLPDGAETVVVASGEGWADALAAMPVVDAEDAGLVLTRGGDVPTATVDELRRLAPDRVVVLGGTAAVSAPVADHVAALTGAEVQRIAGDDRFETAAAIDAHARPGGSRVAYAVTGSDWVDALAAGPAVAAEDARLLGVDTTLRWPAPDLGPAIAAARSRAGHVSIAVRGTAGSEAGHQPQRPVAAASTLKVMFLVAYLRQPAVAERDLTADDLGLLEPMITRSENAPATTIANRLGSGPLDGLAAEVGMQDFAYTRPWGNTRTSARDQVRLMAALPDVLPERHRAYALDLLTRIVPEQRWGIGTLDLPGWVVRFKGGWGSGTGSVDHQSVRLEHASGAVVSVAVTTTSSPSHAYATETLELVFREVLATLP